MAKSTVKSIQPETVVTKVDGKFSRPWKPGSLINLQKMNEFFKILYLAGGLFVIFNVALASPAEEGETRKEIRSPAIDDDFSSAQNEQEIGFGNFFSAEKLFNSFLQLPTTLFKFFGDILARQPFARLREEMRNLNISYPK